MTEKEFRKTIQAWDDFIEFCNDNEFYNEIDSIYDAEAADRYVDERVRDMLHDNSWEEIRDYLNNLPESFTWGEYYRLSDYDEFDVLNSNDLEERIEDFICYNKDFFEVEEEILEVSCVLV